MTRDELPSVSTRGAVGEIEDEADDGHSQAFGPAEESESTLDAGEGEAPLDRDLGLDLAKGGGDGADGSPLGGLEELADDEREVAGATDRLSGLAKAAVFILSLDESAASNVLRCLSDEELSRVAAEIAHLGVVDKDTVEAVRSEFQTLEVATGVVREGGVESASRLLSRSLPSSRARRMVQLLEAGGTQRRFGFLSRVPVSGLVAYLQRERPQTIAVILAHMSPATAAEVIERLPNHVRRKVLPSIAKLRRVNDEALRTIESALRRQFEVARCVKLGDGTKTVAELFRSAGRERAEKYYDDLEAASGETAVAVRDHLFDFRDLIHLEDRFLRRSLRTVDRRELAVALTNVDSRAEAKVFRALSRRRGAALRRERQALGPVRLSDVEVAQRAVAARIAEFRRGREEKGA